MKAAGHGSQMEIYESWDSSVQHSQVADTWNREEQKSLKGKAHSLVNFSEV